MKSNRSGDVKARLYKVSWHLCSLVFLHFLVMFPPWIVRMSEWEWEELSRVGGQKEDEGRAEMVRCKTEPVFVNLLRSPEIDSQPGGPVQQPYLS